MKNVTREIIDELLKENTTVSIYADECYFGEIVSTSSKNVTICRKRYYSYISNNEKLKGEELLKYRENNPDDKEYINVIFPLSGLYMGLIGKDDHPVAGGIPRNRLVRNPDILDGYYTIDPRTFNQTYVAKDGTYHKNISLDRFFKELEIYDLVKEIEILYNRRNVHEIVISDRLTDAGRLLAEKREELAKLEAAEKEWYESHPSDSEE